jgi:hypothetical protein
VRSLVRSSLLRLETHRREKGVRREA